jgi:phosphomannomutase
MSKQKIELTSEINIDKLLEAIKVKFKDETITDIDGVKIDFPNKWVHLRKSNTEPIIRIYSEAPTMEEAQDIGKNIIDIIHSMI